MWLEKIVDEVAMDGVCYIQFSDLNIPSIKVEGCIGGKPDNKLDINKNGTDEIGLMPEWFTSCRNAYFVRTYRNGGWEYLVDPIPTHCNQQEECQMKYNSDCNRIYSVGDNEVMIYYSELTDYGIEGKTKRVKIK